MKIFKEMKKMNNNNNINNMDTNQNRDKFSCRCIYLFVYSLLYLLPNFSLPDLPDLVSVDVSRILTGVARSGGRHAGIQVIHHTVNHLLRVNHAVNVLEDLGPTTTATWSLSMNSSTSSTIDHTDNSREIVTAGFSIKIYKVRP